MGPVWLFCIGFLSPDGLRGCKWADNMCWWAAYHLGRGGTGTSISAGFSRKDYISPRLQISDPSPESQIEPFLISWLNNITCRYCAQVLLSLWIASASAYNSVGQLHATCAYAWQNIIFFLVYYFFTILLRLFPFLFSFYFFPSFFFFFFLFYPKPAYKDLF